MANQNIIEKQQVRGTSASIAQYAGKEGQIVFNKDNKRLHVMSGTVGQSTQYLSTAQAATKTQLGAKLDASTYNSEKASFATKSQIPDVSTLATKTEVTSGLASKVNTSTYTADKATFALKTEIPDTSGLATKAQVSAKLDTSTYNADKNTFALKTQIPDTSGFATTTALTQGLAGKANTTHTHAISDITNLQTTLDGKAASSHNHDSTYIKISGSRGNVGGYENLQSQSTALTVSNTTRDGCCITGAVKITVNNGSSGQTWTKTIGITNASATVSLGSSWKWVGGSAPTIAANGVLVVHWCGTFGIANFVSPS